MKKTLQKEFKCQTLNSDQKPADPSVSHTFNQEIKAIEQLPSTNSKSNAVANKIISNSTNIPSKQSVKKPSSYINSSLANESVFIGSPPKKNSSQLSHLHDDVNFKYLKHVVLKFLTSREYEVNFSYKKRLKSICIHLSCPFTLKRVNARQRI